MQFIGEFMNKGYLLEASLIQTLKNSGLNDEKLLKLTYSLIKLNPPKIISNSFFTENTQKLNVLLEDEDIKIFLNSFNKKEVSSCEIITEKTKKKDVEIIEETELKPQKIFIEDFIKYFRDRYFTFKEYLQDRALENLCSIGKLSNQQRNVSIIGMVFDKRLTKNKNLLLEIEDLTGKVTVLVRQDKQELFNKANNVVLDEVIAIRGVGSNEIIFANDVLVMDCVKEIKKHPEEIYAVFTADLHIGSNKFFQENFLNFISWLNGEVGNEKQKEISKKVKYLFIVGDCVDGVGVYPKQESELLVKDIYEQYKLFAEFLRKIRKDVTIIVCPGGKHDAVYQVEPQPKLSKEFAPELYDMENVILVPNPSLVRIAISDVFPGLDVLIYHGDSYDYYMDRIDYLRINNSKLKPDLIMQFLLKKRHLAPTHTSTTYYPCEKDLLAIRKIPDIFVSGHIHKSAVSRYNGILTISCACWQAKTSYQEKFGHEPDPCKIPIVNLQTGKASILDFS